MWWAWRVVTSWLMPSEDPWLCPFILQQKVLYLSLQGWGPERPIQGMTIYGKEGQRVGGSNRIEKHQCSPFRMGVHEEGFSPNQPPTIYLPAVGTSFAVIRITNSTNWLDRNSGTETAKSTRNIESVRKKCLELRQILAREWKNEPETEGLMQSLEQALQSC